MEMTSNAPTERSEHLVKGRYTDSTITVYQAYPENIANNAVEAGTFVAPFKRERMTWIKPSFLWMMYRSGWAEKPGQERVLALEVSREGLEWALSHACLSHFAPRTHASKEEWSEEVKRNPVRIQWDPERSLSLSPLPSRAIQIGLSGEAVGLYVDSWITDVTDITDLVHEIHSDVRAGKSSVAMSKLPTETAYPLPEHIRRRIGADPISTRHASSAEEEEEKEREQPPTL